MSSAQTALYQPLHTALTPAAAAMLPTPMGQRLRVRQRLATHVYLAEICDADHPKVTQLVLKMGRLGSERDRDLGAARELSVSRQLQASGGHRNVVRVLDTQFDASRGLTFIVMEHCNGGDLFSRLIQAPEARFSEQDALQKLTEITRGVQFLHDHNIGHRDLSLENVLLHDGECKVCDLGLSVRADVLSNQVVGKTQYAAPEVVRADWYDPLRADMWSLGVMLFMMLTGSPLVQFASPSCPEFLAVKFVGVRGVLLAWGMDTLYSDATIDLLAGLLAVDPVHRIATAKELLSHPALAPRS